MSNKNNVVVKRQGLGLGTILTIIFVVLKLVGVIEWSWVWVLSPIWITVALSFVLLLIGLLLVVIAAIIENKN